MKRTLPPRTSVDIRLIPAVISVGAILFALKAGGLAFSAHAASAPPQNAAAPAAPAQPSAPVAPAPPAAAKPVQPNPLAAIDAALPIPKDKPALTAATAPDQTGDLAPELDGTGVSAAEVDVLSSLSDRRDALDQRQRALDLRAQVIAAAEKRIDGKIAELKTLEAKIDALLGERDQKQAQQLDSLVRVYSAMKPKDAARVFTALDDKVRLEVAGQMKPDVMAGVLSALPSEVAQKLTLELAGRYTMDAATASSAAAAAADAKPAPGTPAATPAGPGG
jgi:flagellar motility protein MotE (MotC chaperone)